MPRFFSHPIRRAPRPAEDFSAEMIQLLHLAASQMSRSPARPRSLGSLAAAWLEYVLHDAPQPWSVSADHFDFLVDAYTLDEDGRRVSTTVHSPSPKGELSAAMTLFEALGPSHFKGWALGGEVFEHLGFRYMYQPGEPMGFNPGRPVPNHIRCY